MISRGGTKYTQESSVASSVPTRFWVEDLLLLDRAVGQGLHDQSWLLILLILILVVGAIVFGDVVRDHAVRNPDDVEEPEKVEGLQGDEEGCGNVLADPAFVLLRLPVELKGSDVTVGGEEGPDDLEVEKMTEVDPHAHEYAVKGCQSEMVEIVKSLDGGQEPITDVVRSEDGDAHVGEVETVAESDKSQGDDMVTDELLEVLAGLLHAEEKDNGLLGPVGGLEKVVKLELGIVRHVRIGLVHAASVKVPDRCPLHHVHAIRTQKREVDGRVHLFHEACLFILVQASTASPGAEELLHDKLAGEGQHNRVEGHKGDIQLPLAILSIAIGVVELGRKLVGEKDEVANRVGRCRVHGVGGQNDGD